MENKDNVEWLSKKELLLLILVMGMIGSWLLVPFAGAEDLTYMKGNNVNLKIPCINNGTYCSGSSACYLTLINPDGTTVITNQTMTNEGYYHSYNILSTSLTELGDYVANVNCVDGSLKGFTTTRIKVTSYRSPLSDLSRLVLIVLWLALAGFIYFFFGKSNWAIINIIGGILLLASSIILTVIDGSILTGFTIVVAIIVMLKMIIDSGVLSN